MRPAAEVAEQLARLVDRHARLVGLPFDQFALHELALLAVLGKRLVARNPDALVLGVALGDLLHPGLDPLKVFGRERLLAIHVVEEALLGGGAYASFVSG